MANGRRYKPLRPRRRPSNNPYATRYGSRWEKSAKAMFDRAGQRCRFAGVSGSPCKGNLSRHHKIPRVISHDDSYRNVQILCWRHHEQSEDRFIWRVNHLPKLRAELDARYAGWRRRYPWLEDRYMHGD